MQNVNAQGTKLENILIINEFIDIFPKELLRLPLEREIKFCINLVPGILLISILPYRMALVKLKELKDKFWDLLHKGFIQLSTSPWGKLILFVKKKNGSLRFYIDYR